MLGDCLTVLPTLPADSFDACITDPPYHLTSIVKRFSSPTAAKAQGGVYERSSRGFMGQTWDGGDVALRPETWAEVLRVLKPGAHLAAFGGTRTFHRMAVAIEDAGFEIRDTLMWVYGTGFPKSHNLDGEWQGWGTALKPAWEPIILARKPLAGTVAANVLAHGTGALNIDACRIEADDKTPAPVGQYGGSAIGPTGLRGVRDGGADSLGRWPANVLHDGSDEVLEAFAAFGERTSGTWNGHRTTPKTKHTFGEFASGDEQPRIGDSGSAARFFYAAKASAKDRAGSKHPTVKPLALMRWLCTLITPPGGHILDPFAGSGTTLQAAQECGFRCTGIEMTEDYHADTTRRMIALLTA